MATRTAGTRLHIQPREGKLRLEVQPEGYTWLSFWFDDIPELRDMLAAAVRHNRMPRKAADDALAHARDWVGSYEDDEPVGYIGEWCDRVPQSPTVRPGPIDWPQAVIGLAVVAYVLAAFKFGAWLWSFCTGG